MSRLRSRVSLGNHMIAMDKRRDNSRHASVVHRDIVRLESSQTWQGDSIEHDVKTKDISQQDWTTQTYFLVALVT